LHEHRHDYGWWIGANGFGGALCGLFSLAANPLGLPVFCTLGPALFGAVTGWMLARLLHMGDL
jgi:hypothetical protein